MKATFFFYSLTMSNLPNVVTLDSSSEDEVGVSNFLTIRPIASLLENPNLPSFAPILHWINNDFNENGDIITVNVSPPPSNHSSSGSSSSFDNVWNASSSSYNTSSGSSIVFDTEHSYDSIDNQLIPNIVVTYATATSDSDNNNVILVRDTAMQDLDLQSSPPSPNDLINTSEEEVETEQ